MPEQHSPTPRPRSITLKLVVLLTMLPAALCAQWPALAAGDKAAAKTGSALQALEDGRMEDVFAAVGPTLAANPADGSAHHLLCRAYYAQDMIEEAVRECEAAAGAPNQTSQQLSEDQLWLGRAYGQKARHAGPITAFRLARRVQACFAKAVELDPSNGPAINDLGEYYVDAPAIVGGGIDKARALAASVMPRFPGRAHLVLARVAVEQKDKAAAEAEFKQVIAFDKTTQAWVDLAAYYQEQGRAGDAVAAVQAGLTLDRTHGPSLVDAASVLTAAHREPALAERCLRLYLASHAKTDEAPAFKVHLQLSRLLTARGLQDEAGQQMQAAMALAPIFMRNARASQEYR